MSQQIQHWVLLSLNLSHLCNLRVIDEHYYLREVIHSICPMQPKQRIFEFDKIRFSLKKIIFTSESKRTPVFLLGVG